MIVPVEPDTFTHHFEQFQPAVRRLFPVLGFSPEAGERFIRANSEVYEDTVFTVELAGGRSAFGRRCEGWDIVYLLPSHWPERYRIVRKALQEIQEAYLQSAPLTRLFHRIDEQAPSHSAYYAALLPELGFDLEPRVRMSASLDVLETATLPTLPQEIQEIRFTMDRLPEFIAVYQRGYAVHQEGWPTERRARSDEAIAQALRSAAAQDDRVTTWVGVECGGAVVGSCFGSSFRDRLFVEELALLPEYYGRGLGRWLLLRCMQQLREQFGKPGRTFVLDCYRTYERALRLYRGVGFEVTQWYTDASFWPVSRTEC